MNAVERHETRGNIGVWSILAGTSLISILVGALVPPTMTGLPGWPYAMLAVVMPLYGRALNRRRRALEAEGKGSGHS